MRKQCSRVGLIRRLRRKLIDELAIDSDVMPKLVKERLYPEERIEFDIGEQAERPQRVLTIALGTGDLPDPVTERGQFRPSC